MVKKIPEQDIDEYELTPEDLLEELQDEISVLVSNCKSYDEGNKAMAKPIANSLINLFHESKNEKGGKSLLAKLALRDEIKWFDYSSKIPPSEGIDSCSLIYWNYCEVNGHSVEPYIHSHCERLKVVGEVAFNEWWTGAIAKSHAYGEYSRADFAMLLRNKVGAHVATKIPRKFQAMKDGSFISNMMTIGGVNPKNYVAGLNKACVRTIAHEALITLEIHTPTLFTKKYVYPTDDSYPGVKGQIRFYGATLEDAKPNKKKISNALNRVLKG